MEKYQFWGQILAQIPGFLLAIVVHEYAHARVALYFGDQTAKSMGRVTLDPLAHIDLFGTIIFPFIQLIIAVATGGASIFFGWARPVPINPKNFRSYKKGLFWVSFAGPLANFFIAFISLVLILLAKGQFSGPLHSFVPALISIFYSMYVINVVIGVFNLLPIPPLDGAKIFSLLLPSKWSFVFESLERYAFFIFLLLMFTGFFSLLIKPFILLGNIIIQ